MGFLDSLVGFASDKAMKFISHSLGPVGVGFDSEDRKVELSSAADLIPKQFYSRLFEQDQMKLFEKWMVDNGKRYWINREKMRRFDNFKVQLEMIDCVCEGKKDCSYGLTVYNDMSSHDFGDFLASRS